VRTYKRPKTQIRAKRPIRRQRLDTCTHLSARPFVRAYSSTSSVCKWIPAALLPNVHTVLLSFQCSYLLDRLEYARIHWCRNPSPPPAMDDVVWPSDGPACTALDSFMQKDLPYLLLRPYTCNLLYQGSEHLDIGHISQLYCCPVQEFCLLFDHDLTIVFIDLDALHLDPGKRIRLVM
jgi:hypothetical protein